MTIALGASLQLSVPWQYQSDDALGSTADNNTLQYLSSYAPAAGTGLIYRAQWTLGLGSATGFNLQSGALLDPFGQALSMAAVRLLLIENLGLDNGDGTYTPTAGADLTAGDSGSGGSWTGPGSPFYASGKATVRSGASMLWEALAATTPYNNIGGSAGHQLVVQNSSVIAVTFNIIIIGE